MLIEQLRLFQQLNHQHGSEWAFNGDGYNCFSSSSFMATSSVAFSPSIPLVMMTVSHRIAEADELEMTDRPSTSAPPSEATTLLHKARESLKNMRPPIHHVRSFVDDFQEFIQQGNMIDLAVGIILGKSFTAILDSFVGDILSPILSLFSDKSLANYYVVARCPPLVLHCTSDTWPTWQEARASGAVTVNYGQFTENFINFLIYALFLYIAIKKVLEVLFQRTIVMKRQCPACKEFVRGNATVCKECGHQFLP